jgi:hypothetical protein
MVKTNSVLALVILGLLGSCHQRRSSELDPRIPAANPGQYEHVDAKNWRNPYLVVVRDGVTLISTAIAGGEKTITLDQLRDSLKALPVSDWPYGRVVGYQEIAVRSGDDDQMIRSNWGMMLEILESMDIDAYGGWVIA